MKPLIAVTTYGRFEKDLANPYYQHHFSLPTLYIDAIRRAGGIPLLVPPGEANWDEILATVDGVLITGGADVNPAQYEGNTQHEKLTTLDLERDQSELTLVKKLTNGRYLPTLGICRGMQVINVALGGSLYEHVADIHPEDIHRGPDGGWTVQEAAVYPHSLLAEVMQAETVATYSGHHQGVNRLAPDLKISAVAADGIIEAVEHAKLPWLIGVQWHPEITAAEDVTQQRLFDELVQEAIAHKKRA